MRTISECGHTLTGCVALRSLKLTESPVRRSVRGFSRLLRLLFKCLLPPYLSLCWALPAAEFSTPLREAITLSADRKPPIMTTPKPVRAVTGAERDRHEKGSAMQLIRADNLAMEEKSARLKALRLQQEALASPTPAPKPKPATKAAAKKKAEKAPAPKRARSGR